MYWFKQAFSRYSDFQGRTRRKEFWGFYLGAWFISAVLGGLYIFAALVFGDESGAGVLAWIIAAVAVLFAFVLIVPTLAVCFRRCHDIGASGVIAIIGLFIPLVIWIVGFIPGQQGPNEYGADPKA